jgi:hypothetical protein
MSIKMVAVWKGDTVKPTQLRQVESPNGAPSMKIGKQTIDATKAAALYMLKNGLASYKETLGAFRPIAANHSYLGRES